MKNYVNGVKFENVEKFKKFLDENLESEFYNIEKYLEDLDQKFSYNDYKTYELSKFETKEKITKSIDFDVIYTFDEDMEIVSVSYIF